MSASVLRRIAIVAGVVVVTSLVALPVILSATGGSDHFAFLKGHSPTSKGVMPLIEHGRKPRTGWTWQYRIYSWDEPWETVCIRAGEELKREGFVAGSKQRGEASWQRGDDVSVIITASRSRTMKEAAENRSPPDPHSTCVLILEPVGDNWLTHLRYALERSW